MKSVIFIISMMFCTLSVAAQGSYVTATDAQQKEIVAAVANASSSMKTMQCDFMQVKELSFMDDKLTSEGKMYYKQPDKIRWEYIKPYKYIFSMDGQNVNMTSGDKTNKIPVKQSKIFSEISGLMISGVSGKGLIDSPDFTTQFMVGKSDYKLIFTPQKKAVKEFFSSVELFVNKSDSRIRSVVLIEKNGDKTTITLKNIQLNTTIDDKIFSN